MEEVNGTNGWVKYIKGTMNLIVTSPHGGYSKPTSIPDREGNGIITDNDALSQEASLDLLSAFNDMGYYPHLIYNCLHRCKVDQNRPIDSACLGNADAECAYRDYHSFVEQALASCHGQPALLVDLHGQSHKDDWIEVGYGVEATVSVKYIYIYRCSSVLLWN